MLKHKQNRIRRRCRAELHEMMSRLSLPVLLLCFTAALLPALLLSALLCWKAFFFPAALPAFCRGLFLPLWLLLSVVPPALCASVLLSFPAGQVRCILGRLLPVCMLLLLLADLYVLLLLYHLPYLLCVLCALGCALGALCSLPAALGLSLVTGLVMGLTAVWNILLALISLGF